ncbi:MAG: hypothetical protein K0R08_535 [Solimicrobium sp.]|nr:hypothetical protein [Solimicrobium sp.]
MQRINNSSASRSLLTTLVTEGKTPDQRNVINQIYEKARASVNKEENCAAVLAAIEVLFDKLVGSGNLRSSHLPVLLQEALIIFIMCKKEVGYFLILPQEILSALDALIAQVPEEPANALKQYKYADLSALLTMGIQLYNQHQPGLPQPVGFGENFWQFVPSELQTYQCSFLSVHDQLNLSSTCKAQDNRYWRDRLNEAGKLLITPACPAKKLFLENLKYRSDPYIPRDQIGIDYLQKELGVNCGPLTIQKIKRGELTIEQAKQQTTDPEKRAKILQDTVERLNQHIQENLGAYTGVNWSAYSIEPLIKYCLDGTLGDDSLRMLDLEGGDDSLLENLALHRILYFLNNPAVQKYLDNGIMSIGELCLDEYYKEDAKPLFSLMLALNNSIVQTLLDNGKLALKCKEDEYSDCPLIIVEFNEALTWPGIQKYLQNGQLTVEQLIDLAKLFGWRTSYFCSIFENTGVQKVLDNGKASIEQLLHFMTQGNRHNHDFLVELDEALEKSGVQKYLDNGELTVKLLFTTINVRYLAQALDRNGIQKYLDNKTLTIKQFAHLSDIADFAKALDHPRVQEWLKNDIVTINQLIDLLNITEFIDVLDKSHEYKLRGADQYVYAERLIKLPNISTFKHVISHEHVQFALEWNEINSLQLINLPNIIELSHALRNRNIYKLLVIENLTIPQLINLPNISAFVDAVNHSQIRVMLKRNEVTAAQLINTPDISQLVKSLLVDQTAQDFH